MSQPKLDILMATYNGEAYISQQIYSLQQQTFTDWRLLIHDDGSTDRTIEIIRELAATDQRICLIEDGLCFHSAGRNFMHLLSLSTAPFISFCDEDDIWLQNKLSTQMEVIQAEDNNIPQCVYCNAYVYNVKARRPIGGISILNIVKDLHDVLFANGGIQGCAMIINDKLREKCLLFKGRIARSPHHARECLVRTFYIYTSTSLSLSPLYRRRDRSHGSFSLAAHYGIPKTQEATAGKQSSG